MLPVIWYATISEPKSSRIFQTYWKWQLCTAPVDQTSFCCFCTKLSGICCQVEKDRSWSRGLWSSRRKQSLLAKLQFWISKRAFSRLAFIAAKADVLNWNSCITTRSTENYCTLWMGLEPWEVLDAVKLIHAKFLLAALVTCASYFLFRKCRDTEAEKRDKTHFQSLKKVHKPKTTCVGRKEKSQAWAATWMHEAWRKILEQ